MFTNLLSIKDLSNAIVTTLENGLGTWYVILFNAIGVIAILLQILSFQMRNKSAIVLVGICNNFGWLTYFVLQGDFTSAVANLIAIMSKIIILLQFKHSWAKSNFWNYFFLVFAGVFSSLTFKGWKDSFIIFSCVINILAFFMTKENNIRKVALVAYCFAFLNSFTKQYYVALIADVTALLSIIIALIRYRKVDAKNNENVEF